MAWTLEQRYITKQLLQAQSRPYPDVLYAVDLGNGCPRMRIQTACQITNVGLNIEVMQVTLAIHLIMDPNLDLGLLLLLLLLLLQVLVVAEVTQNAMIANRMVQAWPNSLFQVVARRNGAMETPKLAPG